MTRGGEGLHQSLERSRLQEISGHGMNRSLRGKPSVENGVSVRGVQLYRGQKAADQKANGV
jgi:hypothetical protein